MTRQGGLTVRVKDTNITATATIIQEGAIPCSYTLSAASGSFGTTGGSGSVSVNAVDEACPWTASSNNDWISLTSGASGTGDGPVMFSVKPNPAGAARSGSLTVAGQTYTVNQSGAANVLVYPYTAKDQWWDSEVCAVNTSATATATGNLYAFAADGSLVGSGTAVSLAPHQRMSWQVSGLGDAGDIRYMVLQFSSTDPTKVKGYTKFFITGDRRAAVPACATFPSGDLSIAHIGFNDIWWTGLGVVNTTGTNQSVDITFNTGLTKSIALPAGNHAVVDIKTLVGEGVTGLESAELESFPGMLAMELFGSGSMLAGVKLSDDTATTLYYPHVAEGANWWTGVVAYNTAAASNTLTITAYNASGDEVDSAMETLAAGEHYMGTIQGLGFPADTAWLKVEAEQPITGIELFGSSDMAQLAGFTTVNFAKTSGIFPKIESDGVGWTGIAFVNTQPTQVTVTLTAYNDSGSVVASTTLDLDGNAKVLGTEDEMFEGQDVSGATYIGFSATGQVAGFQLNGSLDLMMLDALPAL